MTSDKEGHYFLDPESSAEMARLLAQEDLLKQAMGGLLPERPGGTRGIQTVLDLGCGPGGWIMDLARESPGTEVYGIDISELMIEYATSVARAAGLHNAHFLVMDASKPLVFFPDACFDLINVRYLAGFLPAKEWLALFLECRRLLRVGGTFRLTDVEFGASSTSASLERMMSWLGRALWRVGQSFSPLEERGKLGIIAVVPSLFRKARYDYQGSLTHLIEFSKGTEYYEGFSDDWKVLLQLAQPFIIGSGVTSQEEFDLVYKRMLIEMNDANFCATRDFHTFWGRKP